MARKSRKAKGPSADDKHGTESNASSVANSIVDATEEQDSFEDAVDEVETRTEDRAAKHDEPKSDDKSDGAEAAEVSSVRSLTNRSVSTSKSPPPKGSAADGDDASTKEQQSLSPKGGSNPQSRRTSSPLSSRISGASKLENLDNVNLDDEMDKGRQVPQSPSEKEPVAKTLSLSSITSALPAMPWSPPAESPAKSPGPSANAVAPPPPAGSASNPPPPTRKLTSPFSWLSRNSANKDKDTTPAAAAAQVSGRRNTASSIATLTSNPEMMLSKLEEENDTNGGQRESLKDRFKALRMREEAGIQLIAAEGDQPAEAISVASPGVDSQAGDKQLTPVPNPNEGMAPGTASGVNAGPSAMQEAQVDWDLWQSVVYEGPAAVARTSPEELNRAIATGIPNAIRGVIWQVLAQSKNEQLESVYKELVTTGTENEKSANSGARSVSTASSSHGAGSAVDDVKSSASSVHSNQSATNGITSPQSEKSEKSLDVAKAQAVSDAERKKRQKEDEARLQKLEKTIRRDLGARTSFSKYAAAAGLQDGLFGVCKAYALYDEGVGYAQGMNFLIMPLLFNMPEDEAFCLLVRLMHQYKLRDMFIQDMPGLHLHLYQFERLLEDLEPALYCHLRRRSISPHLYATQWFLTLFAYRFPLQLVLRIYDLILSEGISAILRFGIVLMQRNASTLLGISDMQQLTTYLKDKLFDVYIDKDPSQGSILENGFFGSSSSSMDKEVYRADQLVTDACDIKLTPEILKAYTTEWEEKTKMEGARETELQELRQANQSYAQQLRKLEERVQACDQEQAAMATEMVHTKVQNEELRDENESLKGQVQELRVVIEKQPTEIEEAWKLERDNLMQRNQNVHEENQKLEKELAELEEELVQTKMRYAEINSQHETLNRKWSDLKRQFA